MMCIKIFYFIFYILFFVNFSFLFSASGEILLDENIKYQTMDGIGADCYSYPYASWNGWSWNAVKFVFDELNIRYIRLASWFSYWEEQNDNDDPNVINWDWSRFDPSYIIRNTDVPFAKFLYNRGIEVHLGVWNVADWLAGGTPRTINSTNYDELGEYISSYILYMQNQGVAMSVVEVQNEPAIESGIKYSSPEDLKNAAVSVLNALDNFNLSHIFLHLPNSHKPSDTVSWATVLLEDDFVRNRTKAISYHTWWSDNFDEYDAIWQLAKQYNKPVWATEVGYCALTTGCDFSDGTHYLLPETWGTAWDYAMSYYRAIVWSHASRVYHWALLGSDAVVSTSGTKYPSFYILKHFANYILPNSILISSTSTLSGIYSIVVSTTQENCSTIILNDNNSNVNTYLFSKLGKVYRAENIRITVETNYFYSISNVSPDSEGKLLLNLPPKSVMSLNLTFISNRTIYTNPDNLRDVRVYPNPFTIGEDEYLIWDRIPENSYVEIYTVTGQKINLLKLKGSGRILWDVKDLNKKYVSPGVYFYILFDEKKRVKRGKIIILK